MKSGKSLQETSDISGVSINTCLRRLNSIGVDTNRTNLFYRHKLRTYEIDDTIFEKIDTQEKAYILGFLYADGCVNSKISQVRLKLQERDKQVLDDICKYLNYKKPLCYYSDGKFSNLSIIICNRIIYENLIGHGLTPKKSFTCVYPNLDINLDRHFIRGYFDGDGSIYVSDRYAEVKILGSTAFCESMKSILELSNIKSYMDHDKRVKEGVDNLRIRDIKSIINFYYYMYSNSNIKLNRKYDRYTTFIERRSA